MSITVNYVDPFPLDFSWVFDNPESVNNFGTKRIKLRVLSILKEQNL